MADHLVKPAKISNREANMVLPKGRSFHPMHTLNGVSAHAATLSDNRHKNMHVNILAFQDKE